MDNLSTGCYLLPLTSKKNQLTFTTVEQREGDLVILLPGAAHQGGGFVRTI